MGESVVWALHDGVLVPLDELKVPVNDRAYMFGDAVYEVLRIYNGRPFLFAQHLKRLKNSLDAMGINGVVDVSADILSIIEQNRVQEGMVYVQISRGVAPRNHSFYNLNLKPSIFMYAKPFLVSPIREEEFLGIRAITHEDIRWAHCHIKTVNLLPNCLVQTKAHEMGAHDAIFIRDGLVTECTSSNIFCVKDNVISTPPLSRYILPGIRRQFTIDRLKMHGFVVHEEPIQRERLYNADEIFITSTIKEAIPITTIDDHHIGKSCPTFAPLVRKILLEEAHQAKV